MKYITLAYIAWNVIVLLIYALDKEKSKRGSRRISERTLLLLAFFFGAVGAWLGMGIFRHKTKHMKFNVLVPLFLVLNLGLILFIGKYLIRI